MPSIVKTGMYDEDLHGTSPDNLVINEIHTLQVPSAEDFYFIIPRAAPYFVISLKVYNNQTNELYKVNVDYTIGHHFIEAMESIGRPIGGSIRFMRHDIMGQVRLEYRTIGGNWGFDDNAILAELSRKQYNPITRVWGNIAPMPYSFPPLIHDQSTDTLVGSDALNDAINRIADAMEATTGGVSEHHITNYANPHRTTKKHVGLEFVDNFPTATDEQTVEGTSFEHFVTPRSIKAAVVAHAMEPLNLHASNKNNPHQTTKTHVGLGKVENFATATALEALDASRNDLYLTPYTASLLVQAAGEDPRLEGLLAAFNEHISATNPHNITTDDLGTLTEDEIIDLITSGAGSLFGGLTPEQWKDSFPDKADIIAILDEQASGVYDNIDAFIDALDPTTAPGPGTPVVVTSADRIINSVKVGWNGYSMYNRNKDMLTVGHAAGQLRTGSKYLVSTGMDASYYVNTETNKVTHFGTQAISLTSESNVAEVWASAHAVYWTTVAGALKVKLRAGGISEVLPAGFTGLDLVTRLNTDSNKVMTIIHYTDSLGAKKILPHGATDWVIAVNAVISAGSLTNMKFTVGSGHVITTTATGVNDRIKVFKLDYSATITLTEVTNTLSVVDLKGNVQTLSALNTLVVNFTTNGIHDTFILANMSKNIYMLLDVNKPTAPVFNVPGGFNNNYKRIFAGNGYLLTYSNKNFVNFWGESPDNSMLMYSSNKIILP